LVKNGLNFMLFNKTAFVCVFFLYHQGFVFGQVFLGDGGRGIVIAVPSPVMQNPSPANNWIPQLFQDIITGDMARFSAMTVLDRRNEALTLAEQQLSANGNYSDENYIRMGNMTNSRYIVAGTINNISGRYHVNFRVNNTETNEIRASFNRQYGFDQIENGHAAKEVTFELLKGLGIALTAEGERQLLALQNTEVRSTVQLARGMAAARDDNIVDALSFLSGALNSDATREEANRNIQSFFGDIPTGSIRERANYAITQKAKWDKIFADVEIFLRGNLPVFIYDFSTVEDSINVRENRVTLTIRPGVKVIPNRAALFVYKTIWDNWSRIKTMPENGDWVNNVSIPRFGNVPPSGFSSVYRYNITIGLYDEYGDRIANSNVLPSMSIGISPYYDGRFSEEIQSQQRYYADSDFREISFYVPLDRITDTMTPRIERVLLEGSDISYQFMIMTVTEWQEWLAGQGR